MSTPRLIDALDTLGVAISAAINAAQIPADPGLAPGQTVEGWAVTTELTKILAQNGLNHLVVLWPLKSKNETIWNAEDTQISSPPTVDLTVTNEDGTLTFAGTIPAVYNVHIVFGTIGDVLVQTTAAQTLDDLASAVAAAINAADLPGTSAEASGAAVPVTSPFPFVCNIGGTGSVTQEIMRVSRLVQVSVYAPNPMTRTLIADAILGAIGTAKIRERIYPMSDGQALEVFYMDDDMREKAQSSYSAFEHHIWYRCRYPVTLALPATQIGAIKATRTIDEMEPQTSFYG